MRGSRYSDEQRRKAARAYVLTGSAKQAAAAAGVPERTARHWCQPQGAPQPSIFAELYREERARLDRIGARIRLANKTLDQIEDQLTNGEPHVVNGVTQRRPIPVRELARMLRVLPGTD
jgi:hypothetical protein